MNRLRWNRNRGRIASEHEPPEIPYICISVADTGIGMDETTLAHAVEPFFSTI